MMSAFARLPGAVLGTAGPGEGEEADAGAPATEAASSDSPLHYGSPAREQRWLEAGDALVERGDRAVISVTGEDRLTWLDSITSQALTGLAPGESTELLVLDPQGRVEHAAGVFDDGETTWLFVDRDDAAALGKWLRRMVFRARATIADEHDLAVVGYFGDAAAAEAVRSAVHAPAGVPVVWSDPWAAVTPGGHQYAKADPHPGAGYTWREALVPVGILPDVAARVAAGIVTGTGPWPAGLLAADALRVAAWRPRWANEVDERMLPHEVDWLRSAVHLSKGCYRGQETVAKVHNLGHPPRRLVMLHLDGSESVLPAPGSVVRSGDKDAGVVTSSALHHEDGPIALAILSRRTDDATDLTVVTDDGSVIAAAQEVIVPADAGATAGVPRLPRLGRRAPKQ